jgi:hypothetical protein
MLPWHQSSVPRYASVMICNEMACFSWYQSTNTLFWKFRVELLDWVLSQLPSNTVTLIFRLVVFWQHIKINHAETKPGLLKLKSAFILMQEIKPQIYMADSDFDSITNNRAICDSDGNVGPKEFCEIMTKEIRLATFVSTEDRPCLLSSFSTIVTHLKGHFSQQLGI